MCLPPSPTLFKQFKRSNRKRRRQTHKAAPTTRLALRSSPCLPAPCSEALCPFRPGGHTGPPLQIRLGALCPSLFALSGRLADRPYSFVLHKAKVGGAKATDVGEHGGQVCIAY